MRCVNSKTLLASRQPLIQNSDNNILVTLPHTNINMFKNLPYCSTCKSFDCRIIKIEIAFKTKLNDF